METRTKKITVVILNRERLDEENFKNIPYVKEFSGDDTLDKVIRWIKSIDLSKSLMHAYINDNGF